MSVMSRSFKPPQRGNKQAPPAPAAAAAPPAENPPVAQPTEQPQLQQPVATVAATSKVRMFILCIFSKKTATFGIRRIQRGAPP